MAASSSTTSTLVSPLTHVEAEARMSSPPDGMQVPLQVYWRGRNPV